jgi:hypothetical protein
MVLGLVGGKVTVLLATPVRAANLATAQVSLGYADFRLALARLMPDYKALCGHVTFAADVVRGRNRIVATLLADPNFADVDNVLWVDDDNWPEDVRIVQRMIDARGDIVAVPYTNKKEPLRWVHRVDEDGSVLGVGFGFTMTSRHLLETLFDAAERYVDFPQGLQCANVFGQVFDRAPGDTRTLLSEDYSFCKRARDAGFSITMIDGLIHHAGGAVYNALKHA